jgi:hypothetical protein
MFQIFINLDLFLIVPIFFIIFVTTKFLNNKKKKNIEYITLIFRTIFKHVVCHFES